MSSSEARVLLDRIKAQIPTVPETIDVELPSGMHDAWPLSSFSELELRILAERWVEAFVEKGRKS
jgi:hypothetical protein